MRQVDMYKIQKKNGLHEGRIREREHDIYNNAEFSSVSFYAMHDFISAHALRFCETKILLILKLYQLQRLAWKYEVGI